MAIVSVFCKECSTYVLSCSEQHYVLFPKYTFVNIELLIYLPQKIREIYCAIHGKILDEKTFAEKYSSIHSGFFKKHVHLEDNPLQTKVLDYSKTYLWDIPTNKGYEGPYTQINKINSEKIEIYGVEAIVGEYSFHPVFIDDERYSSLISIKENKDGFFQEKKFMH